MTPIIKRLEMAEAALLKNGFVLVDDVWVPPALPKWIDDAKGRDPLTDDLIAHLEGYPVHRRPKP